MAPEAEQVEEESAEAEAVEVSKKELILQEVAERLEVALEKGDHISAAVRKIAKLQHESVRLALGDYLSALRKKGLKDKTVRTLVFDVSSIAADLDSPISKWSRKSIEAYFQAMANGELRKSPKGVDLFRRQLRKFVAFCVGNGISAKSLKPVLTYLTPERKSKPKTEED